MEPSADTFDAVMYPTALYAPEIWPMSASRAQSRVDWTTSYMNPKNRIETFQEDRTLKPCWRIDGGEADGTRFFAIPDFALGRGPLRIDVYIPDQCEHPDSLREILQSDQTITRSQSQLASIPLAKHLLRALATWSHGQENFEDVYLSMPFGSKIIFENIAADITKMNIHLVANYDFERELLSIGALQTAWDLPEATIPALTDLNDLELKSQLHEAVAIVSVSTAPEMGEVVFKSVVRDTKYLYHELKMLLTLSPHSNVISCPLRIVTKHCRFGGKVGVCGFLLPYHRSGTLRDKLWHCYRSKSISLPDQLRWAHRITSALIHLQSSPGPGFYSDLKLNNIVMTVSPAGRLEPVLIDFEQRGGWYSWSPPEVYFVEYFEYLAESPLVSAYIRERATKTLRRLLPTWTPRSKTSKYVDDTDRIYSAGWQSLSKSERESAQVFMLGKLLWCVFESLGAIGGAVTIETFREEELSSHDPSFPQFRRTPRLAGLRDCITACTAGAAEWRGRCPAVVRRGDRLYPRDVEGADRDSESAAAQTQRAAREWWRIEIEYAERFIEARRRQRDREDVQRHGGEASSSLEAEEDATILGFMRRRPTLKEVLAVIGRCKNEFDSRT